MTEVPQNTTDVFANTCPYGHLYVDCTWYTRASTNNKTLTAYPYVSIQYTNKSVLCSALLFIMNDKFPTNYPYSATAVRAFTEFSLAAYFAHLQHDRKDTKADPPDGSLAFERNHTQHAQMVLSSSRSPADNFHSNTHIKVTFTHTILVLPWLPYLQAILQLLDVLPLYL